MIKVLKKSDGLLLLIAKYSPVSFSELLRLSGMNKATLSQILKSMSELLWVVRDENGLFSIGSQMEMLVKSNVVNLQFQEVSCDVAQQLNRELNELVSVAIFSGGVRRVIAKYQAEHFIQINEEASSAPETMLSTATGLVLLSGLDEAELEIFAARNGLESEVASICGRLDEIRRDGYCELLYGKDEGVSIAVGVKDSNDEIMAAIGFSAPSYRFYMGKKKVVKLLQGYASKIGDNV